MIYLFSSSNILYVQGIFGISWCPLPVQKDDLFVQSKTNVWMQFFYSLPHWALFFAKPSLDRQWTSVGSWTYLARYNLLHYNRYFNCDNHLWVSMVKESVFLAWDIDIGTFDFLLLYLRVPKNYGDNYSLLGPVLQHACLRFSVKWLHYHNMLCLTYIYYFGCNTRTRIRFNAK